MDRAYLIPDAEALPIVFDLLKHEGCAWELVGSQCRRRYTPRPRTRPGHVVVTILADYGTRYQSKLFNPEFLRSKGLPVPDWLE